MTTANAPAAISYTEPASLERLERAAAALTAHGFTVEILDDAAAARDRIPSLIPAGARVFTAASETLRLSGIEQDINSGGLYLALKPALTAMDRATQMDEIRQGMSSPGVSVGSVAALTEDGAMVAASASGSQLPGYAGGAGRVILVIGAQKLVPDLAAALRRLEEHALPLEDDRARQAYGVPSAANSVLIMQGEPYAGRTTVLLLREAIGF